MDKIYYLDVAKVLEEFKEVKQRTKIFEVFSKFKSSSNSAEVQESFDFLQSKGILKKML